MYYALDDYYTNKLDYESDDEYFSSKSDPGVESERIDSAYIIRSITFEDRLQVEREIKLRIQEDDIQENVERMIILSEFNVSLERVNRSMINNLSEVLFIQLFHSFESRMRSIYEDELVGGYINLLTVKESLFRSGIIIELQESVESLLHERYSIYNTEACLESKDFLKKRLSILSDMTVRTEPCDQREQGSAEPCDEALVAKELSIVRDICISLEKIKQKQRKKKKKSKKTQMKNQEVQEEKTEEEILEKLKTIKKKDDSYDDDEHYENICKDLDSVKKYIANRKGNISIYNVIRYAYELDLEPSPFIIRPYSTKDYKTGYVFAQQITIWLTSYLLGLNINKEFSDSQKEVIKFSINTMINLTLYNMIVTRYPTVLSFITNLATNHTINYDLTNTIIMLNNAKDYESINWLTENGLFGNKKDKMLISSKFRGIIRNSRDKYNSQSSEHLSKMCFNGTLVYTPYFTLKRIGIKNYKFNVRSLKLCDEDDDESLDSDDDACYCTKQYPFDEAKVPPKAEPQL